MSSINLIGEVRTEYITDTIPTGYAKIMEFDKKKMIGTTEVETDRTFMVFRLYNGRANFYAKEYYLYARNSTIFIKDLTNSVIGIDCFIAGTDTDTVGLYVKGANNYAEITLQVIHAYSPAFFRFNQFAKFNVAKSSLTGIMYPLKENDVTFVYKNSWVDSSTAVTTLVRRGSVVDLIIHAKSGTMTNGTELLLLDNTNYAPISTIEIPITYFDGTTYITEGVAILTSTGSVRIYGVTHNTVRNDIHFNYIPQGLY